MKAIDVVTTGARRLLTNRSSFSLAADDRGFDAILLVLGVIVTIALLWVAGGIRSQDQRRSEAPADQAPVGTTAAGH